MRSIPEVAPVPAACEELQVPAVQETEFDDEGFKIHATNVDFQKY
jgi:hypothetical protein